MDLSIIIPSFNTKDLLDRCLHSINESLKSSSLTYEVIVVDNASTDGSVQLLNTKYPRIIKILNKVNIGYGKANNQGIQKSKGRFILLLNSDIKVLDNAIQILYDFAQKYPNAFIGGKLFNEDNSPQPSCGPMYTLPVVFFMLFAKGDALKITRSSPDAIAYVDWISGACIMAKKDSFLHVGLFDEEIFMYMEELEFLYRAKQKKYTVLFYPLATFVHSGAASSEKKKEPVINIYRGLLYFYHKHRSIMEQRILRLMLKIKAYIVISIGKLTNNSGIVLIYEKALHMV